MLTTDNLRKAATCCYLAFEKSVADDLSARLTWAADEIERLQTENWLLKQACGYPIPADMEIINNPFKCGMCDARRYSLDNGWNDAIEAAAAVVEKYGIDRVNSMKDYPATTAAACVHHIRQLKRLSSGSQPGEER